VTRAFPDKDGCDVPSIPAINEDDYAFDSCNVPTVPSDYPFHHSPMFNNPVPPPGFPGVVDDGGSGEYVRVTGNTVYGPNQWVYDAEYVIKMTTGYGGWEAMDGMADIEVYNMTEDPNTGAGVEGHGVNIDGADFPQNFSTQPIPNGVVRKLHRVPCFQHVASGGDIIWENWIEYENAVDGLCDPEPGG